MPPFDAAMAKRHKKGMSPKQVRQWCAVAQSSYSACINKGGSASSCEARAIRTANGVTGPPAGNAQRMAVNAALVVAPEALTLHECDFLSAPGVLLVCGVLNDALILEEALIADDWNYIPVTLGHPMDAQGHPVSAHAPSILEQYGVGYLVNARLGTGERDGHPVCSLQADILLDLSRVETLQGEAQLAHDRLQAQEPLEVSTGFHCTALRQEGTFLGTPYHEVIGSITPDHLALLPNALGACSWTNGGCGAPRLHHDTLTYSPPTRACACQSDGPCSCEGAAEAPGGVTPSVSRLHQLWDTVRDFFATPPAAATTLTTAQTDIDVRESIQSALMQEHAQMGTEGDSMEMWMCPRVEAVTHDDQTFVYREDGQLKRRGWSRGADGVITLGSTVSSVQTDTSYLTVPGTEEELTPMAATTKTRWINALIANEQTSWTEDHRPQLETLDEAFLMSMAQDAAKIPLAAAKPRTFEEMLADASDEVRESHQEALENIQERKAAAITVIKQNKHNPYSDDELQLMTARRLEQLVAMSGAEVPLRPDQKVVREVQYVGRLFPQAPSVDPDDQPPPPPNTFQLVVQKQRERGVLR